MDEKLVVEMVELLDALMVEMLVEMMAEKKDFWLAELLVVSLELLLVEPSDSAKVALMDVMMVIYLVLKMVELQDI